MTILAFSRAQFGGARHTPSVPRMHHLLSPLNRDRSLSPGLHGCRSSAQVLPRGLGLNLGGGQQQGESCPPPWGGGGEGTGRARVPSQPWGSGALEASDMASGPRALQAQPTGPTVSWGDGNTSRLLFQHPRKQNRRELLRGARQIHCQQDANETKLISSKQRMAFSSEV